MSRTQSTMVELGTVAPAFELVDVVSGRALGRDEVFALSWDDDSSDQTNLMTGGGASKRGRHGLLVMFVCVHCPYVKHVEEELARIGGDYEGRIAIAAISSNDVEAYPQDGPAEMKAQAERLGWRFPYLLDSTQEVALSYHAACTPDFFLYDAEMKLVYRGQLDESRPRRGDSGNDVPATGADLRRAMDDVHGRASSRTPTNAAAWAATSNGKVSRQPDGSEVLERLKDRCQALSARKFTPGRRSIVYERAMSGAAERRSALVDHLRRLSHSPGYVLMQAAAGRAVRDPQHREPGACAYGEMLGGSQRGAGVRRGRAEGAAHRCLRAYGLRRDEGAARPGERRNHADRQAVDDQRPGGADRGRGSRLRAGRTAEMCDGAERPAADATCANSPLGRGRHRAGSADDFGLGLRHRTGSGEDLRR